MDNKAVFQSIEEAKRRSAFFRQGAIVPNWVCKIVKGQKWKKHNLVFGSPSWVFNTGHGPLVLSDAKNGKCAYYIKNISNTHFQFNPYAPGEMFTIGNHNQTENEWLEDINRRASEMMNRRSHEQSA